jgi:hypothetical protein
MIARLVQAECSAASLCAMLPLGNICVNNNKSITIMGEEAFAGVFFAYFYSDFYSNQLQSIRS